MRLLLTILAACSIFAAQARSSYRMEITINGNTLQADMDDNQATDELKALLENGAINVDLHEYGGFERVGSLPRSFTASDQRINALTGDIVLYLGKQIVFMLGSNTWSYTRLGHINADRATLELFFGPANSMATLSLSTSEAIDEISDGIGGTVEYYDLQGRRIVGEPHGLVIERGGHKTSKIYVK